MDEQEKNNAATTVVGAIVLLPIVVGGLHYMRVVRTERKKRQKIKEWETMNLEAAAASYVRLKRIQEDPNSDLNDFITAINEEGQFLNLIKNQPMY